MDVYQSKSCPQEIAGGRPAIVIVDNDDFKIDIIMQNVLIEVMLWLFNLKYMKGHQKSRHSRSPRKQNNRTFEGQHNWYSTGKTVQVTHW